MTLKTGIRLFLLLFLVFMAACAAAETGCPPEEDAAVKRAWSSGEFTEDYLALWQSLYDNYPFFPVLEQQGTDPAALETEYLSHVRTCGDLDAYCRIIRELFFRMGNTAHLELLDAGRYEQYRSLIRDGIVTPDSPAYQLVTDRQTAATYGLMAAPQDTYTEQAASASWSYDAENRILILRIPTFRQEAIERDAGMLTGAAWEHPDMRHIIFDIRGNTGGSALYWMDNLVAPFGKAYLYRERLYYALTPLNRLNGLDRDAEPLSRADDSLPDFVKELGFTHSADNVFPIPRETYEGETVSCDADRWVLTDGAVFSAADSFVSFCKQSGFATVVGTRTRGDGDGVAPCLIRLPATGLLVRFSTTTCANEDGSLNAVTGHAPDIPCKPKETAMDACLRLIGVKRPR